MSGATLWRNGGFLNLWGAQTISQFGNQVTVIALPLAAVAGGATSFQMGVLGAIQYVPYLAVGLLVGVWADRVRRRPLLVAASLGRTVCLLVLPVSVLLGVLRLETLFAVALAVGILALVFDVAYTAMLPTLVTRDQIVEANSRLTSSLNLAQIAGPGLGGFLVQLLTAPIAITTDALAFLASALLISRIRVQDAIAGGRRDVRAEVVEGLGAVWGNPILRGLTLSQLTINVFISMHTAVFVLYLVRERSLSPLLVGAVFSVGSVGGLLGSLLAPRVAIWIGLGMSVIVADIVTGIGAVGTALPAGQPLVVTAAVAVTFGMWQMSTGIVSVNGVSLRQASTPNHLQGRVQASVRTFTWGVSPPAGFLLGGFLGQFLDLRFVLAIGGVGMALATVWLIASPIARVRAATQIQVDSRPMHGEVVRQ